MVNLSLDKALTAETGVHHLYMVSGLQGTAEVAQLDPMLQVSDGLLTALGLEGH